MSVYLANKTRVHKCCWWRTIWETSHWVFDKAHD